MNTTNGNGPRPDRYETWVLWAAGILLGLLTIISAVGCYSIAGRLP